MATAVTAGPPPMSMPPLSLMSCVQRDASPPLHHTAVDLHDSSAEMDPSDRNEPSKKRRFHPFRGLRKMFKRKVRHSGSSGPDDSLTGVESATPESVTTPASLRSRSTSELLDDTSSRRKSGGGGIGSGTCGIVSSAGGGGLSVSHDSVFTAEPHSGSDLEDLDTAQSTSSLSGQRLVLPGVRAELLDAVRRRRRSQGRDDTSEDDEDLGLPRSPCNSPTTATDMLLEKSTKEHPGKSHSTCSDNSLLSMGSSEMDEDSFGVHSAHSSKVSLYDKRTTVADTLDTESELDLGESGPASIPLSHSAARHKMAVRPKRTHGAPRRKRVPQLTTGTSLPTTPEVNEDSSARSVTPEIKQELLAVGMKSVVSSETRLKSASLPPGLALSETIGSTTAHLSRSRSNAAANSSLIRSSSHANELGDGFISVDEEEEITVEKKKEESFFGRLLSRRSGKKKKEKSEEVVVTSAKQKESIFNAMNIKKRFDDKGQYVEETKIVESSSKHTSSYKYRQGPASRQRVEPIEIPASPELIRKKEVVKTDLKLQQLPLTKLPPTGLTKPRYQQNQDDYQNEKNTAKSSAGPQISPRTKLPPILPKIKTEVDGVKTESKVSRSVQKGDSLDRALMKSQPIPIPGMHENLSLKITSSTMRNEGTHIQYKSESLDRAIISKSQPIFMNEMREHISPKTPPNSKVDSPKFFSTSITNNEPYIPIKNSPEKSVSQSPPAESEKPCISRMEAYSTQIFLPKYEDTTSVVTEISHPRQRKIDVSSISPPTLPPADVNEKDVQESVSTRQISRMQISYNTPTVKSDISKVTEKKAFDNFVKMQQSPSSRIPISGISAYRQKRMSNDEDIRFTSLSHNYDNELLSHGSRPVSKSHSFKHTTLNSDHFNDMPSLPYHINCGWDDSEIIKSVTNKQKSIDEKTKVKTENSNKSKIILTSENNVEIISSTAHVTETITKHSIKSDNSNKSRVLLQSENNSVNEMKLSSENITKSFSVTITEDSTKQLNIKKSASLDSVKSIIAKTSSNENAKSASTESVSPRPVTLSGPLENIQSPEKKVSKNTSPMLLIQKTKFENANESNILDTVITETAMSKSPQKKLSLPNDHVPEFLKIQLNKVDVKPTTNIVLTTLNGNSVNENKDAEIQKKNVDEVMTKRKFSKDDVEIIEKEIIEKISESIEIKNDCDNNNGNKTDVAKEIINENIIEDSVSVENAKKMFIDTALANQPLKSTSPIRIQISPPWRSLNNTSNNKNVMSTSATATTQSFLIEKPFLKKKSNSLELIEPKRDVIKKQLSDGSNVDKIDDEADKKSEQKSSESSPEPVIMRKKSVPAIKRDEEPELMKVFARRSLKLNGDSELLSQQVLIMLDDEEKNTNVVKSRDSDKENEVESPHEERRNTKDVIKPKEILVESKTEATETLLKTSTINNVRLGFGASKTQKPNSFQNQESERPKPKIIEPKPEKPVNNIRTNIKKEKNIEIVDEENNKNENKDTKNEDLMAPFKRIQQRKQEWEQRAQQAMKKSST